MIKTYKVKIFKKISRKIGIHFRKEIFCGKFLEIYELTTQIVTIS